MSSRSVHAVLIEVHAAEENSPYGAAVPLTSDCKITYNIFYRPSKNVNFLRVLEDYRW